MFAGDSGTVDIRGNLVARNFPVPVAAPVQDDLRLPDAPSARAHASLPRSLRLLGLATEDAIGWLPKGLTISGVVYGGKAAVESASERDCAARNPSEDRTRECLVSPSLALIREILDLHGHGPFDDRDLISINNLTVSSNQAIGLAFQRIRRGLWERALVVAAYGCSGEQDFMNFHMLGALSTNQGPAAQLSRPFSASRSGFVLGEGAAALVLETGTSAQGRGATTLGSITGYATTSDAYRVTDGRPDVRGAAAAMQKAVQDAGLSMEQITAISAHGTATPMNDRLETLAIKTAFGQAARRIAVTSLKSQVGHCLAASGALEAVASLLMLAEQKLAPTINYTDPDPECDLDYVPNSSRPASLRTILSNNFGFGGQNSCVVFERA
jgi:3-oxoacyl-[acyl-carrier-protein] synthase II